MPMVLVVDDEGQVRELLVRWVSRDEYLLILDRVAMPVRPRLRGEANRRSLLFLWRRTGGRNSQGPPVGRAPFLTYSAGAHPLVFHAGL